MWNLFENSTFQMIWGCGVMKILNCEENTQMCFLLVGGDGMCRLRRLLLCFQFRPK
jgi:hypothetical protein